MQKLSKFFKTTPLTSRFSTLPRDLKIISRKLRQPNYKSFLESLSLKDRIPAWLKFSDICMSEERNLLSFENMLDLLVVLGPEQVNSCMVVIDEMNNLGMTIDDKVINTVLVNLAKLQDFKKLLDFLSKIKQYEIKMTTSSYNIILRMYLIKSLQEGLAFISKMKSESILFNQETYSILISSATRSNRPDLADQYLQECIDNNLVPDIKMITELIRMYYYRKDPTCADMWFEKAKEGQLDDYIYGSVLYGCDSLNLHSKFDETISYMQIHNPNPGLVVLTIIIKNYLKRGLVSECFVILKQMKTNGLVPDLTLNSAIVNGCCEIGKSLEAKEYIKELVNTKQAVSLRMYRSLLQGLARQDEYDHLIEVYDLIKRKKLITPIYNTILKAACSRLDLERFEKVKSDLDSSKFCEPNEISYLTAFEMFTRTRQVVKARRVYGVLQELQYSVPKELVLELISGAIQGRLYADAAKIISMMRKLDKTEDLTKMLSPHADGFKSLIKDLGKEMKNGASGDRQLWFLVLDVYKEVLEYQPQQDEQVLQIVMESHRSLKDLVSVVKVWSKLEKSTLNPTPKSLSILLQAGIELGHSKTANVLITLARDVKYRLILLICKFTDGKELPSLLIDMINNNIKVDGKTWKLVKRAFVERRAKGSNENVDEAYGYVYGFFEEQFPEIVEVEGLEIESQVKQAQNDRI
jgi:pentatricopeptide repeat protein